MFHIVDDKDLVREVMIELLIELGCKAISFGSPSEYINFVSDPDYKKPIAVFTDVQMPEMNGYKMINTVSKLVPDLKFVVISSAPEVRSEYLGADCTYLGKPFNLEKLKQLVENLM